MFQVTHEKHYYPKGERAFQVSEAAAREARANWHEILGWADGWADVSHPDWLALYNYLCEHYPPEWASPERFAEIRAMGHGPTYCVFAKAPGGATAHIGSITMRGGQLTLNG